MYYDDDRRRKRKTETNKMRDGNETSFATLLRGDLSIITRQLKETEKKEREKIESSELFPSTSCKWGDDHDTRMDRRPAKPSLCPSAGLDFTFHIVDIIEDADCRTTYKAAVYICAINILFSLIFS